MSHSFPFDASKIARSFQIRSEQGEESPFFFMYSFADCCSRFVPIILKEKTHHIQQLLKMCMVWPFCCKGYDHESSSARHRRALRVAPGRQTLANINKYLQEVVLQPTPCERSCSKGTLILCWRTIIQPASPSAGCDFGRCKCKKVQFSEHVASLNPLVLATRFVNPCMPTTAKRDSACVVIANVLS